MTAMEHALYVLEFINTYYCFTNSQKALREAACLKVQFTHCILTPQDDDLLLGKYEVPCVGFAMQESGILTLEQAERILFSLFQLMNHRKTTWDGRVIIGGPWKKKRKKC